MSVTSAVVGVIIGCMLNAICLELLVKSDPGCGTLVTFSQFAFIAIEGFIFTMKFGTKKRHIPLLNYAVVVALFFSANMLNNYAFDFKVSMPLHMIFRSGSLIANLIMNIWVLKRSYSWSKWTSVILITIGVVVCTLASGHQMKTAKSVDAEANFFWWSVGIFVLVLALLISARLGIYQEKLFTNFGKHPYEAMFYTHLLPLPTFVFFYQNVLEHFDIALKSAPIDVLGVAQVPSLLLYLLGNVTTQYLCISSVYTLTSEATSLTVTLVVTLRKFLSLLMSIVAFQNAFTVSHWLGAGLVFVGTLIYTDLLKLPSFSKSKAS